MDRSIEGKSIAGKSQGVPQPHRFDNDEARIRHYLAHPEHQQDRKPFRPFYFVLLTFSSVTGLLSLAWLVVKLSGVEV
ncbi:MAG: DUF3094 family protein [Cellvibrionales bacterium]|nr:DUF3094 family protein [Cellvibrionales bacterium]